MHLLFQIITYTFLFVALYIEVFFLITYLESSHSAKASRDKQNSQIAKKWLSVSVIVPVWNEETTVLKTIFSLLKLNYPKDKLFIFIVDDGSTDNTWQVIQRFAKNKQIKLLRKQNGGKYTALNYALSQVNSELVGCLDADSFVHPEALKRIVVRFEDPEIMAVTPSIKVFEPKGWLGLVQKAEYIFGIFLRKVLLGLNAIYITPGPLSIFRRSVFERLGDYKHAYNTEDIEIALRMQKNRMKIDNVHNAYIYTIAPTNLKTLFKQRLRWVYGFLKNAIDYREMFFNPHYGNLGLIVLPAAGFSVVSTLYFFIYRCYGWIESLFLKIQEIYTVGFYFKDLNLDIFYFNTEVIFFISLIAISGVIFIIIASRQLAEEETKFGVDSVFYLLFYALIAPFWMIRAVYNLVFAKATKWR